MNAFGKILTVFVFLFSLVWLGLTVNLFATRAEWKKDATRARAEAAQNASDASLLKNQIIEERKLNDARLAAADQTITAIRTERDNTRKELVKIKDGADKATNATEILQPTLDKYQQNIQNLLAQVTTLTASNAGLTEERDRKVREAQDATNKKNDALLQEGVTKKALDDQIEKTRAMNEAKDGGAAGGGDADFRGDVLKAEGDIVVFSGGANAGVKNGRRYVVTRTTAPFFLGTITVSDASDPRFSSGIYTPPFGQKLGGQYSLKAGDTVSSK